MKRKKGLAGERLQNNRSKIAKEPITSKGRLTKKKILQAAEQLFGEKGYELTSVVQIAAKARIVSGTFYLYFDSKKAVLDELVKELNLSLRREIGEARKGLTSSEEGDRAAFRAFFSYILKRRNLYRIMDQVEFIDNKLYRWHYEQLARDYRVFISKAVGNGEYRKYDSELVAYCLIGMAASVGARWCVWDREMISEKLFDELMSIIMDGLRTGHRSNAR